MNFKASSYASLLIILTTVFLLITAQLNLTISETRISRMYERYSGLYDIGVCAAQAKAKEINSLISDSELEIIREYMEQYDWEDQCELKDGVFLLSGVDFYKGYKEISGKYINTGYSNTMRITHDSGINISINANFRAPGIPFNITVINDGQRPLVKNMTGKIIIECTLAWNPNPPAYILEPHDIHENMSFSDFNVTCGSDYVPLSITGLHRI